MGFQVSESARLFFLARNFPGKIYEKSKDVHILINHEGVKRNCCPKRDGYRFAL